MLRVPDSLDSSIEEKLLEYEKEESKKRMRENFGQKDSKYFDDKTELLKLKPEFIKKLNPTISDNKTTQNDFLSTLCYFTGITLLSKLVKLI